MKSQVAKPRQDDLGRAFAGSQLQLQIYVNRCPDTLSRKILAALAPTPPHGSTIRWVSPLEVEKFVEYVDEDFLSALGLRRFADELLDFWPARGPNWDGLAVVETGGAVVGYILAEAKSYVAEMQSSCMAKSPAALAKIDAALAQTKQWLGVQKEIDWKIGYYQFANRLAHLYFLREIAGLSAAWLVNLCFVDDPHCRTSIQEWESGLAEARRKLALPASVPWICDVLLPARARAELLETIRR
jgi:hypothetical protein